MEPLMKFLVLGLVLATSAFAQMGNWGPNGPVIGCLDEHLKEGLDGVKLCLKAQAVFIDKKHPDKRLVTFHTILEAAVTDATKKTTTAKDAIAKLIGDTRASLKNSASAYQRELRSTVTSSASARALYANCTSESRSERFFTNSCTNLAQKVSDLLDAKMRSLEWGQNFNKKIYADFDEISGDLKHAFSLYKRFDALHKQLEAEYFAMGYTRDDASEGAVKANEPFAAFVSKYDGMDYAHKADVLRELKNLGIIF